ncbi:MAG: hypothetical protein IPJ07_07210 [Acidobacteria bacterium]|nr:hypothetical protein [Acidobacteriota bacterium]
MKSKGQGWSASKSRGLPSRKAIVLRGTLKIRTGSITSSIRAVAAWPMMLELEGADIATELTVQSAATREPDPTDGTTPDMMDRPVADIPAVRHVVRLAELKQGMITFEQAIVQNIDTVQIQLVPGDGALDREFTWADLNQPRDGDYYYLRVTQVDGSMAWTSPFWIGGQARRYTPPAK